MKISSRLKDTGSALSKKESTVITCNQCGQKLRIPLINVDLNITCSVCKSKFTHHALKK